MFRGEATETETVTATAHWRRPCTPHLRSRRPRLRRLRVTAVWVVALTTTKRRLIRLKWRRRSRRDPDRRHLPRRQPWSMLARSILPSEGQVRHPNDRITHRQQPCPPCPILCLRPRRTCPFSRRRPRRVAVSVAGTLPLRVRCRPTLAWGRVGRSVSAVPRWLICKPNPSRPGIITLIIHTHCLCRYRIRIIISSRARPHPFNPWPRLRRYRIQLLG